MRPVLFRRLAVAATLVVCCALCFGRLVIHPFDTLVGSQSGAGNDLTEYFQPVRLNQIQILRQFGQLATWDPYSQLGRPLVGNPQTASYYPPNWIYFLFGTERISSWVLVLHHLLAGWGMYLLCQRYQFGWQAALVGAVTFMAAPYFVAQTAEGHYSQCTLAAWLPWALICFERLRTGRRGSIPLMSIVLALAFFCGHPQELYYLVIVLSLFWLIDLIRPRENVLPRKELAMAWVGAGLLTFGLVAIDLIPTYATSLQTTRGQGALSAADVGGASWSNLRQIVYPFALGGPAEMLQDGRLYWETLLYVGVVPLILAITGTVFCWRSYPTIRYAVLLLTSFVFALGASTPLFPLLHEVLPGMSKFRVPSRIMFIAAAAVAMLAAAGAHYLLTKLAQRRAGVRMATPTAWLLVALIAAELTAHAWAITRTIPLAQQREGSALTERFANTAAEYRVWVDQQLLSDEDAFRHRIAKCRGYDPYKMLRYASLLDAAARHRDLQAAETAGYVSFGPQAYARTPLSLMGVRYLAVVADKSEVVDAPNWKLIETGQVKQRFAGDGSNKAISYHLYENEDVLPRAFVLGHARTASGFDTVDRLAEINPREVLLLPHDLLPPGDRQDFAPATVVEYTPSRVVVDTELTAPGYLVLCDLHAFGWRAAVDGQSTPIVPVNLAFRGVPLAAGPHRVTFEFSPPLWTWAALVTLLSILLAGWYLFQGFRKRT